jgi:formiminoglutamase
MPNPDMSIWTGREDAADGPRALRWHQMVKPLVAGCAPGVVLVGFACDEGVRRNGGRVGAKDGPRAIRAALANLAWHQEHPVYDAGDVCCDDGDMEGAQLRLAEAVSATIAAGHRPLILGGGHETAWGTFQGIVAALAEAKVGVINIDAHLDLRADRPGNSGTPFSQIAEWCRSRDRPFHYFCLGVSIQSNSAALVERADALGAVSLRDSDIMPWQLEPVYELVASFANQVDLVYLSLDLDVLPAPVLPAVSSPAARGVPLESVEPLVGRILALGKTAAVDIVELNPTLDIDGRGTRVAACLAWHIARNIV